MQRSEWQQAGRRLRWRLRGASQWPTFLVLTMADGVILALLPFYEPGPGGLFPSLLLAGFANLFIVAIAAPLFGRVIRTRRPDLPRVVARDYAGTILLAAGTALLLAAGIAHRPAAAAASADRSAAFAAVHSYVLNQQPALRGHLAETDLLQLGDHYYRACVPRRTAHRWLCLIVTTKQQPAGLRLDHSQEPNGGERSGMR
jgi:hypothetical protein